MIIPVRCFSCGRVIGDKWEEFEERTENGEDGGKVLDELGVKNYCCRTVFLTTEDQVKSISQYKKV